MVTPPYKEGFAAQVREVSKGGSQLRAGSLGNFVSPEGRIPEGTGNFEHSYRLSRTELGWTSVPVDAPFSRFPDVEVQSLSPDFGNSLWFASAPGQSSADVYLDAPGGPVVRVGPGAPPEVRETVLNLAGASEDLSHVLFIVHSASAGLEEEHLWPGDTTHGGRRPSLYEYAGTGQLEPHLVGVKNQMSVAEAARIEGKSHINEAAELISDCGTVLGSLPEGEAYNAVSASGATVFFTSEACGSQPVNELYARIDDEKTVPISEPGSVPGRLCTTETCANAESVPGNRKPGVFAGASADGSKAFFLTTQPLVNADADSGPDLYEEDISAGKITRLEQVSGGGEGDLTPGSGAEVLGVARISEDGSHVYFVAQGVLTHANREGKAPIAEKPNLYVSVEECPGGGSSCEAPVRHTSFIATLSGTDSPDWGPSDARPVQSTPDGRFLVFQSTADLTSDQDEREEAGQVFEYEAQTETLVRVSRGQNGYNEDGNSITYPATFPAQFYEVDMPDTPFMGLAVSADGFRVFFVSADALTPQALEGVNNVYEYHDGQVALISDGHDIGTAFGATVTELIGTDESGEDVFFTTADQLVPQDRDTWVDVYDARMGGGFAPLAVSAPCSGDSCQGAGSSVPPLLIPGLSTSKEETPVMASSKPKVKATKTKKKTPKKKALKKRKRRARKSMRRSGVKITRRGS